MIHNVDSHTGSTIHSQEHPLKNCVHKQEGFLKEEASAGLKGGNSGIPTDTESSKQDMLGFLTDSLKHSFSKGIGFFKGIWNDSSDNGTKGNIAGTKNGKMTGSNTGTEGTSVAAVSAAMENLADIRPKENLPSGFSRQFHKISVVLPALKAKTQQSRERFAAKKDAFWGKMKKLSQKRHSFEENKQERPGQQTKEMEWLEIGNDHLLDSYNEKGEYSNLGNRIDGQGYGGSAVRETYSEKV